MAFEPKIAIDGTAPYSGSGSDSTMTSADFQNQPKDGKTWKILKMQHECYAERALDVKKQDLLYQGGFQMNDPEVAKLFCPKMINEEDDTIFKERVQSAAYVPTFSKLITGLVSNLFSQDLSVMEAADHNDGETAGEEFTDNLRDFYKLFHNDCDGHGTTLHDFMRNSTVKALIHSFCYFGVDYPKGEADNRLQQEQLGLDRPRLYKIDSESVFDWKCKEESVHEFEWIKLLDCRPVQATAYDPPMHQYFVKIWFINEEGLAAYECYQSEPLALHKEPKDKDVLKKVDEGVTSFKCIPIFYFCLDEGIAVGAKLAPMAAEHFNRTTIENHQTNRACLTVPVLYRGEMMPGGDALPDPTAMNTQRGTHPRGRVNSKGVVELGTYNQDKFEIVEAEGKALAFIHKQNEDLDEKMHSVVHQMGQSLKQSRSQSGKTGLSKQEDRRSTEMLLTALADEIYGIVECIFTTISESRDEDIVWDVKGLSALSQEDREELVKEAALVTGSKGVPPLEVPSLTFKKEYLYRLTSRLIDGTDQRTLQTIRKELEEGLEEKDSQDLPMVNAPGGTDMAEDGQNKSAPAGTGDSADSDSMSLGPAGQPLMPEGSHLQTGEHVDSNTVYNQLAEDYQDKDIQFVKHIPWIGPVEVPLTSVDFSNKDNWQASQPEDQEHVDMFADKMQNDDFSKPVILVNNPSNDNKMMVVDGHHRALAAQKNGQPINAYVGQIGSDHGPWDALHSKQVGSKQESSQQESLQKEASKQSNKSAEAKGGKTK